MNISVISVFPELYTHFLQTSLVKRAQEEKKVQIETDTFFSYVEPKERIDAPAFGPGAGMVIRPEVVERAVVDKEKKRGKAYKIFFSPQGKKLTQRSIRTIVQKAQQVGHVMLIPARYEGIDVRAEEYYADEIVSVGDFVLMSGDVPAMMLLEAMLRLIPGVIGKEESVLKESFSGPFVDFPTYTHPVVWHNKEVPEVVRSGNHGAIQAWRQAYAVEKTVKYHFEWLRSSPLTQAQKAIARTYIPAHYVVLMHTDVLIGPEKVPGTTSVTSIDIHDIARSSYTYGIENFFVVTPLHDQQAIVQVLLDFWQNGPGFSYNESRYQALREVQLKSSMDEVLQTVAQKHDKKPLVIATSARTFKEVPQISFYDQGMVWGQDRPVILVLGTGKGLTQEFIKSSDYLLMPLDGFSEFNHLSVRSAAAIILDRWLGINVRAA
jgi:tRNA (guanine37-N1)-methyltransferase